MRLDFEKIYNKENSKDMAEIGEEIINPDLSSWSSGYIKIPWTKLCQDISLEHWEHYNWKSECRNQGNGGDLVSIITCPLLTIIWPMAEVCFLHTMRTLTTIFSLLKKTKKSLEYFFFFFIKG